MEDCGSLDRVIFSMVHQIILFRLRFVFLRFLLFPVGAYFCLRGVVYILDWKLFDFGAMSVEFRLILDYTSLLFSAVVLIISSNVIWFSLGYIGGEFFLKRFAFLVFFFVLSINILIFSCNLIPLLLGWDGLGLTSFLLVVYYQNSYSLGAGLITVFTNRLGDVILIISIGLLLVGGHWSIYRLQVDYSVGFLVLVGAITKRAQFPFSS